MVNFVQVNAGGIEYLGTNVATEVPQIHSVTGKIKILKKCLDGKEKLRFLNKIVVSCKVSYTTVKDVEKFIQTVCYSRKEEILTETRVRLKNIFKQHIMASQSLPPDEKPMLQAIKRVHYEVHDRSGLDEAKSR